MEVLIREMKESDVSEIAIMEKLSFKLPWSEDSFFNEVNNSLAKYFVAESEGKVIGYIGMWQVLDEGHITNIAVHPDYRRKRIGFQLVETMMNYANKTKLSYVLLEVRVGNINAQNLYKKFGFKKIHIRKKYYADNNEDAIIMQSVL